MSRQTETLARIGLFRSLDAHSIRHLDTQCSWRRTPRKQWIIDYQDDAAAMIFELRQHPVGHRLPVELRCRRWRFRAAGCTGSTADRAEEGQPELLGILLIALHLQDGKPVPLPRAVGPGAQQRRLPAAGRSRDDRHLARRRAIQGSNKISPVDQPGNCWSHCHRPALISTPDTSGAGHAVVAPSASLPGRCTYCQRWANPGSAPLSFTHRRRDHVQSHESPGSGGGLSPGWRRG